MNKALAITMLLLGSSLMAAVLIYGAWHQLFFVAACYAVGICLLPARKQGKSKYVKFLPKK